MKKLISLILLTSFFSQFAFADCDFKTGITPGPNNTYIYSRECHLKVGAMVLDLKTRNQQIVDLNKSIELKNQAILVSDTRANNWMSTSENLENRLEKIDSSVKHSEWLYFGLGVLTTFAAGYAAARLAGH